MQTWTEMLCNSRLPVTWAWVSYRRQMWPKLDYGLGTNSSPVKDLQRLEEEEGDLQAREDDDKRIQKRKLPLWAIYRRMLARLGINRNVKRGWRHISQLYGGIGLRRMLPEITIARINLFLQHYKSPSAVGMNLTSSLEHLQLEAGYENCPLHRPFHPLGELTTPCWMKSLWKSLDCCNIKLTVDYPTIPSPREGYSLAAEFLSNRCEDPALLPGLQ